MKKIFENRKSFPAISLLRINEHSCNKKIEWNPKKIFIIALHEQKWNFFRKSTKYRQIRVIYAKKVTFVEENPAKSKKNLKKK